MEYGHNQFFDDEIKKAEKEAESLSDEGHLKLVNDLKDILNRAYDGKYHDFHVNGHDAPKVELVTILESLIHNTKIGKYEN